MCRHRAALAVSCGFDRRHDMPGRPPLILVPMVAGGLFGGKFEDWLPLRGPPCE